MFGNNYDTHRSGLQLQSTITEIVGSQIRDEKAQHVFAGVFTYIANSIFVRNMPELASHSLIFATNTHLHLNNVTIDAHPVEENVITNEPSHLMMANTSTLSIVNTVISSQPGASGPLQPLVRLESTFIALNVSNHVDDGSLPGAGSGPAQLDSQSRPMAGSPLIDAGTDAHAISALTGEALEFGVEGFGRITGARVDIGALEVQQFYAINDMYTTPENTSLTVDAPGVLANDTFTGKLKNKAITVVEPPKHGVLGVAGRNGGFLYVPNPDFHGTDTFTYFGQFTGPPGLTNVATVTIKVEAVDSPPVANPDAYQVVEGQTLNVAAPGLLGNDTDPDNLPPTAPNAGLTVHQVNGEATNVGTEITLPSGAKLTVNSAGDLTYVAAAGFTGTDTFSYNTIDPQGAPSNEAPVTIEVHPSGTELGHEGLSHGFRKSHPEAWHGTVSYEGDFGDETITKSIEGFQSVAYHFEAAADYGLGGFTMEEALSFKGGKGLQGAARILLQQAVAALLNAAHHNIDYPLSIDEVIDQVNAALASGDRDSILDLANVLDEHNNLGGDI